MGFGKYVWLVLKTAFKGSIDWTQFWLFLLLLLAGIATRFATSDFSESSKRLMSAVSSWQFAVILFGSVIAMRLILAPYWIWQEDQKLQGIINERNEMGPTVLGLAFAAQNETPDEFDVMANMQIREVSSFPDTWLLDIQLANGRVVTVKGRFNAHSCPVGRYPVTAHFPFSSSIPDAGALSGAKLLRLEGTDMSNRRFVYQAPPGPTSVATRAPSVEGQQAVLFANFTAELSKLTSAVMDLSTRLAGGAKGNSPEVQQLMATASGSAVATAEAWKLVRAYPGEQMHDADFVHPSWSEDEQEPEKSISDNVEPPSP